VTSRVIPTSERTGRPVAGEASAVTIVIPADGPSLGVAPAGTCTWSAWSKNAGSTASCVAWLRTKLSAIYADSFITSPSWPVRVRPAGPSCDERDRAAASPDEAADAYVFEQTRHGVWGTIDDDRAHI